MSCGTPSVSVDDFPSQQIVRPSVGRALRSSFARCDTNILKYIRCSGRVAGRRAGSSPPCRPQPAQGAAAPLSTYSFGGVRHGVTALLQPLHRASSTRQFLRRQPSGSPRALPEGSNRIERAILETGADLVHPAVHSPMSPSQFRGAVPQGPEDDGRAGRQGRARGRSSGRFRAGRARQLTSRVQSRTLREVARTQRAVAADQVKTPQVGIARVELPAGLVVEQRKLPRHGA